MFIIKNGSAKIGVTNSVGNLRLRSPLAFLLLLLTASFSISGAANAHVKWFAAYDVSQTPRTIEFVLASQSFWTAVFLSIIGFALSIFIERSKFGNLISDFLNFLWAIMHFATPLIATLLAHLKGGLQPSLRLSASSGMRLAA